MERAMKLRIAALAVLLATRAAAAHDVWADGTPVTACRKDSGVPV
jgi:hypothetical protein